MAGELSWHLSSRAWTQDPASGRFAVDGVASLFDLGFIAGAKQCVACERNLSFFPKEFQFCPNCGDTLLDSIDPTPWFPPFGNADGTKLVSNMLRGSAHELTDLALPPQQGLFHYFSAPLFKEGCGLFAMEREGTLWHFNAATDNWSLVSPARLRVPASRLPTRSWSIALPDKKLGEVVVPTDAGPALLRLDVGQGQVEVFPEQGMAIGGAAAIGTSVLVPVWNQKRLKLAKAATLSANLRWTLEDVAGPAQFDAQPEAFNAPIVEANRRRVTWVGKAGYLIAEQEGTVTTEPLVRFKTWGPGREACIEFGPPYIDAAGMWQLCASDNDGYAYVKLGSGDVKPADAGRVGTGRASFWRSDKLPQRPWDNPRTQNNRARLTYPLLESTADGAIVYLAIDFEGLYQDFFHTDRAMFCELRIEGSSAVLESATLRNAHEAVAFMHQDVLHFYHPERSTIARWSIIHG